MIKEREALENYIASKNAEVSRDKQTTKEIWKKNMYITGYILLLLVIPHAEHV